MSQRLVGFLKFLIPRIPLILCSTFTHYTYGPPKPSWSYKLNLTITILRSYVAQLNDIPIRVTQANSKPAYQNIPVDPHVNATSTIIPQTYRLMATKHMERLLVQCGIDDKKLGWDWKNDPSAEEPLEAEWTEAKTKGKNYSDDRVVLYLHGGGYIIGSIQTHRWATAAMAQLGGAKAFSVEYRLAPDSPFPSAIIDAMAAYMYLLNPPEDSNIAPVNPKNIVIMGDSAGGGLTFGTMLAIRDAGLPLPAGIVGISPWLDLMHSMPSVLGNGGSDYLPTVGLTPGGGGAIKAIVEIARSIDSNHVPINHPELPEIQYYARNAILDCPYVSPLLEKEFENICPILMIVGDGELLRDEAIVFFRKHEKSKGLMQLLLYDDMPHVFPMLNFLPSADHALQQAGDFVIKVTTGGHGNSKSSFRVGVDCQLRPLEEDAVPGWENRLGKLGGGKEFLVRI
ncbi:hypothetical protein BGZ76_000083 [Entomortierella beljakovae]|nr:hypothetical protein BGZ76_000083 [Entomortierella beljakovae]